MGLRVWGRGLSYVEKGVKGVGKWVKGEGEGS